MTCVVMLSVVILNVVMVNVIILSAIIPSVIVPSVIVPSVVILIVVIPSVIMLNVTAPCRLPAANSNSLCVFIVIKLSSDPTLGQDKLERLSPFMFFSGQSNVCELARSEPLYNGHEQTL